MSTKVNYIMAMNDEYDILKKQMKSIDQYLRINNLEIIEEFTVYLQS